jgi:hypothetical protein
LEEIFGIQLQDRKLPQVYNQRKDIITEDAKKKIELTKKLFGNTKEKLSILKEIRLLELSGLQSSQNLRRIFELAVSKKNENEEFLKSLNKYPLELVDQILKSTWKKISCSILDDMKEIMVNYNIQDSHLKFYHKGVVPSGKYLCNVVEFLNKEGLIGQEIIQSYFHHKTLAKGVIQYSIHHCVKINKHHGGSTYISDILESMAKHWIWPLTHGFFKGNTNPSFQFLNDGCEIYQWILSYECHRFW